MPIRITGMNSGLDTESIISELVKAQKTKGEATKKKQTTLQWKQEAWKDLNAKIYKLFNSTLGNMRLATDYSKKVTDVSNSSIASVVTGENAMNATQSLKVNSLASSGYMTGAEISGSDITKNTKLTDLGISAGSTVTVTTGGKATDIQITADTTMNDFVVKLKQAGVEANFDEKNKRLHIAAKKSGTESDFTLTAADSNGTDALRKLGILVYDAAAMKEYQKYADMSAADKQAAIDKDVNSRLDSYKSRREELLKTQADQQKALADAKTAFQDEFGADIDTQLANPNYKSDLEAAIKKQKEDIENAGSSATEADKEKLSKLEKELAQVKKYEESKAALAKTDASLNDVESYLDLTDPANIKAGTKLTTEVTTAWDNKITEATNIVNAGSLAGSNAIKNVATDAEIELNGVTYKGDTNTFEINGLTITALQQSSETVTLNTRQDTDGIYDMVKDFLKEYNSLIMEMDKLYNAESAKGYDPLTDEEKEEMSDSEIEKWESKIKDSILRGDSNLSTISSAMKTIMLQGANVNGKQIYLSQFGIETAGYFSSGENEKNVYHINGDKDDASVSSKENELKAAIAADPDTVIAFFSQLSQNLYSELDKQSRSVEGIRSFGKFYDDKKMQDDYKNYTTKIKEQEAKLTALEDRWYKKFSAMETALAKMQSNQNAVSALLGG